jgi:hypothetical protein
MKSSSCIALLALALGVAANPVQLANRAIAAAAATTTLPPPTSTCASLGQACSNTFKCCGRDHAACQSSVSVHSLCLMLVCNILLTLHAALFLEMPGYRMSGHVIGYLGWVASMVKAETDCWIYCMSYFHISVVQSEGVLSSVQLKEMNVNLINKKSMLSSFAFPNAEYSGPLIGAQSIIYSTSALI